MKPTRFSIHPAWRLLLGCLIFFCGSGLYAKTGSPDPTFNPGTGPNGRVYAVAVQPDGRILLAGTFTSVSGTAIHSIARLNSDGRAVLAQKGMAVPNADGSPMAGVVFKTLADPVQGAGSAVAFQGTLAGFGLSTKTNAGIWHRAAGGSPKLIARTGDAAPGGGHWAAFKSMAFPHTPAGGPVFLGTLQTSAIDGVSKNNNLGLWGIGSDGTLHLLLRTGQAAFVNNAPTTVKTFTALLPSPASAGTACGYDDDGNIAALVTFADTTQALILVSLP
jgi:hypothetical protein